MAPARQYKNTFILWLRWRDSHPISISNLSTLRWGFSGYHDDEEALIIESGSLVFDHFVDFVRTYDAKNVLIIIVYCGHGHVQNDELLASPESNLHSTFSISDMQLHARDRCKADFLFVLECCQASFFPIRPLPRGPVDHEVVIVGMKPFGIGRIATGHDFAVRLAENLRECDGSGAGGGMDILTRMQMIWQPWQDLNPGFWKLVGARRRVIELRRKRAVR